MFRNKRNLGQEFEDLSNNILKRPQNVKNILIYLSAEYDYAQVLALIRKLKNTQQPYVEKNDINLIIEFLKLIWVETCDTDRVYVFDSDIHINNLLIKIVEKVAKLTGISPFKLLMSTLKRVDFGSLKDLKKYVLSDNNDTLIDVYECIYYFEQKQIFVHTHPINDKEIVCLSETEKQRVINYSQATQDYYACLISTDKKNLDYLRDQAKKTTGDKNTILTYSYGAEGNKKLYKLLYDGINTRNDLIKKMLIFPVNIWELFLEKYSNQEFNEFKKIILEGKEFIEILNDKKLASTTDPRFNKAVAVLINYSYCRLLEERKEERLSMFASYYKPDKLQAARLVLKGLLKTRENLECLPPYLAGPECAACQGALNDGTLGKIINHFLNNLCKIKYQPATKLEETKGNTPGIKKK